MTRFLKLVESSSVYTHFPVQRSSYQQPRILTAFVECHSYNYETRRIESQLVTRNITNDVPCGNRSVVVLWSIEDLSWAHVFVLLSLRQNTSIPRQTSFNLHRFTLEDGTDMLSRNVASATSQKNQGHTSNIPSVCTADSVTVCIA